LYTDEEYATLMQQKYPHLYGNWSAERIIMDRVLRNPSEVAKLQSKNDRLVTENGNQYLNLGTVKSTKPPRDGGAMALVWHQFKSFQRTPGTMMHNMRTAIRESQLEEIDRLEDRTIRQKMADNLSNDGSKMFFKSPYGTPLIDHKEPGPTIGATPNYRWTDRIAIRLGQAPVDPVDAGFISDEEEAVIHAHFDALRGEFGELKEYAMAKSKVWYEDTQRLALERMENDPVLAAYQTWVNDVPMNVESILDQPINMAVRATALMAPSISMALLPGGVLKVGGGALRWAGIGSTARKYTKVGQSMLGLGNAAQMASQYITMPTMVAMEGGSMFNTLMSDMMTKGYTYEESFDSVADASFIYGMWSGLVLEPLQVNSVLRYLKAEKSSLRMFTSKVAEKFIKAKKGTSWAAAAGRGGLTATAFIGEQMQEGVVEWAQSISEHVISKAVINGYGKSEDHIFAMIGKQIRNENWGELATSSESVDAFWSASWFGFAGPKTLAKGISYPLKKAYMNALVVNPGKVSAQVVGDQVIVTVDGEQVGAAERHTSEETAKMRAEEINTAVERTNPDAFEYDPGKLAGNDGFVMKILLRQFGLFGKSRADGKGKNYAKNFNREYIEEEHGKLGIGGKILKAFAENKSGAKVGDMILKLYENTLTKDESGKVISTIFDQLDLTEAQEAEIKNYIGRIIKLQYQNNIVTDTVNSGADASDSLRSNAKNTMDDISNEDAFDSLSDSEKKNKIEAEINSKLGKLEIQHQAHRGEQENKFEASQSEAGEQGDQDINADAEQQARDKAYQEHLKNKNGGKPPKPPGGSNPPPITPPKPTSDKKVLAKMNALYNTLKTKAKNKTESAKAAILKFTNTEVNKIQKSLGLDFTEDDIKTNKAGVADAIISKISVAVAAGDKSAPIVKTGKPDTGKPDTTKQDVELDGVDEAISFIREFAKQLKALSNMKTDTSKISTDAGSKLYRWREKVRGILGQSDLLMTILDKDKELDPLLKEISAWFSQPITDIDPSIKFDGTVGQYLDELEKRAKDPSDEVEFSAVEEKIFVPIREFFAQFGIDLKTSPMGVELFIGLAEKVAELDPNNLDQISEVAARYLTEMLSYSKDYYKLYEEIKKTGHFKALVKAIDDALPDGKFATQEHKRRITKDIFFELLKNGFDSAFAKKMRIKKSILDKIKAAFQALVKKLKGANFKVLNKVVEDVIAKTMKGKDFIRLTAKEGYVRVNFQKAFDLNPLAKQIYTLLGQHPKLVLTGSIAYATQGTVFRIADNIVHDLDFVSFLSREAGNKLIMDNYPGAVQIYDFPSEMGKKHTDTYIVPPVGTSVKNIKRRELEGSTAQKVIAYEIHDANGKVVGTYKLKFTTNEDGKITNEKEIKTGAEGVLVDLFTGDPIGRLEDAMDWPFITDNKATVNVKLAKFKSPFEWKLQWSRFKDIWDYNRFVPYTEDEMKEAREIVKEAGVKELADAVIAVIQEDIDSMDPKDPAVALAREELQANLDALKGTVDERNLQPISSSEAEDSNITPTLSKDEMIAALNQSEDVFSTSIETESKIIAEEAAEELDDKKGPCRDKDLPF